MNWVGIVLVVLGAIALAWSLLPDCSSSLVKSEYAAKEMESLDRLNRAVVSIASVDQLAELMDEGLFPMSHKEEFTSLFDRIAQA